MLADVCKGQEVGLTSIIFKRPGQRWQIDAFSVVRREDFDLSP
jgi:hypothetical protein